MIMIIIFVIVIVIAIAIVIAIDIVIVIVIIIVYFNPIYSLKVIQLLISLNNHFYDDFLHPDINYYPPQCILVFELSLSSIQLFYDVDVDVYVLSSFLPSNVFLQ